VVIFWFLSRKRSPALSSGLVSHPSSPRPPLASPRPHSVALSTSPLSSDVSSLLRELDRLRQENIAADRKLREQRVLFEAESARLQQEVLNVTTALQDRLMELKVALMQQQTVSFSNSNSNSNNSHSTSELHQKPDGANKHLDSRKSQSFSVLEPTSVLTTS